MRSRICGDRLKNNTPIVLNAEQEKVVNAQDGVYAVIASAGTGKTETLIRRHMKMMVRGIPSKDMLNLSFTSAAASEMVRRAGLLDSESVFRTFHSFAIDFLKKERDKLPFDLCPTVIPVEMEDFKLLFDLVKIYPAINWRTLQERITKWKCDNIMPDQAFMESKDKGVDYFYALAYDDYEKKCRERGWLDFDDCIRETINLLESNEEVRNRYKRKYISVDESQDTCETQTHLIQLLFDGNLMCVGDPNQGIFEWRDAAPEYLLNFTRSLPGAQTLFLGRNYRSTKALVSYFKAILPINNGLAEHITTDNEEGVDPTFTKYEDDYQEAEEILKRVTDPINTAIIARTNRQLYVFQRMCSVKGIKYKTLGKKDFWELNEVRKLLDLAKKSHSNRPAAEVLTDLIRQHNLLDIYRHSVTIDSNPIENLQAIVKMSAKKGTIPEFLDYLRRLTHHRRSQKGLTLSTGHQAKGREFDYVYVIGVKQGILPHSKGELAEEARIWYVSCTRAARELHVSFYDNPSQFLNDYQDKIVEFKQEEQDDQLCSGICN